MKERKRRRWRGPLSTSARRRMPARWKAQVKRRGPTTTKKKKSHDTHRHTGARPAANERRAGAEPKPLAHRRPATGDLLGHDDCVTEFFVCLFVCLFVFFTEFSAQCFLGLEVSGAVWVYRVVPSSPGLRGSYWCLPGFNEFYCVTEFFFFTEFSSFSAECFVGLEVSGAVWVYRVLPSFPFFHGYLWSLPSFTEFY